MAYSNFTLETVREAFQLETIESANIFADIVPVPPSEALIAELEKKVQLAVAIRTEKARSELIVPTSSLSSESNLTVVSVFFPGSTSALMQKRD